MRRIAPSVLAADLSDLRTALQQVDDADILHLDVMDGHFVPNISFGQPIVASLREHTDSYFDTHLMIEAPERYIEDFVDAGADRLTIHAEAVEDVKSVARSIHDHGLDAGVAINPETPVSAIEGAIDSVDTVLVMGVNPGFSGQEFIPDTVDKVEAIDAMGDVEIEVDGGIDGETGSRCAEAGAETFVIGSSLFGREDPQQALQELRRQIG